jgi:hypothetical protein
MRAGAWPAQGVMAMEALPWALPPGLCCVIDVSLSLGPVGLPWTLALAGSLPVWLPQGHWALVDGAEGYRSQAKVRSRLGGAASTAGGATFARAANEWKDARDSLNLEGSHNFYWLLGGWSGSVTPKEDDPLLIARHDALASGLDALAAPGPGPEVLSGRGNLLDLAAIAALGGPGGRQAPPDILADCARDALAIAAALRGPPPMLLVAMRKDEERPWLVDFLTRAHVRCERLTDGPWRDAMLRRLNPAILASGLAVAVASGQLRLGVMAVVAPRARCARVEEALEWNAAAAAAARAIWDDACAVWWEVS